MNQKNKVMIFTMTLLMSFFIAYSYFKPIWTFNFIAPQYPTGLTLEVFFNGARGDVFEIDILNHYVGMPKLDDAAKFERAMSVYVIALISFLCLLLNFRFNKIFRIILTLPIILFPFGFIGFLFYWLYTFGHNLNPKAAINMQSFTPTVLGNGKIGQFETQAYPSIGFAFLLIASFLAFVILFIRFREDRK